ncbi:MAG: flavodoxin [Lachnospiraceae bacterium]
MTIVVYYSMNGNTKEAAEKIAAGIGADLLELRPAKPLPEEGGKKYAIGGMQAMFGMCPAIEKSSIDFSRYERIILGCPVWAGKCAPYINTFLKGKDVNLLVKSVFTCSGGGDNDSCIADLKKRLPNLGSTLALADRANGLASQNKEKLEEYIKKELA